MTQPLDPEQTQTSDPKQIHTWGMLCHLLAFSGFIGIPCGNILGPLVIRLIRKDEMPFVDDQGGEVLNFQSSLTIYAIISGILYLIFIGFVLRPAVLIFGIVMTIIGTIKASSGERYRYPCTIRFLE